jgi:UDP-glucose:(heptosyl)LPS alpha-1,3-glucosyltransferase
MTPLKIALLKTSFRASGGLEKYCFRLFQSLRKAGHHVDILSTVSLPEKGVLQICSPVKPSFLGMLWFDFQCRRHLRKQPYDVVFGFDRHFIPLTHYRAGNGCHKAYLERRLSQASFFKRLLLRANPLHLLTLLTEWYTFEKHPPKHIICNSHLVRNEVLSFYPKVPQERLEVFHNGVEWAEFSCHFEQKEKGCTPPHILFIGHEWQRKGLDRLLQALALLKDCQFFLTAVGKERNCSYFTKMAAQLGISDRVCLIPRSVQTMPYLASSSIVVIPSLYDPFANVTVEALAMGLFVITTKANGGGEVIEEGINGFVLEEGFCIEDLSRAIRKSFDIMKNPNASYQIRDSVKELDFEKSLQKYLNLFSKT